MENCFDDERAGEDAGDGGAEEGDDREESAAQGMAGDDAEFGGAFGAGGADEVLVEHFEQAATCEAGDGRGVSDAEHEGGEHAIGGAIPTGGVEPAQVNRQCEDEERADDEGGNRDANHAEGGGDVVDPRVAADGGEGAEADAEDEGDGE